ncbi:Transcriptional adapter ada2 [Tieghemiomyces parasiticus]|uniref:Transcriptional adapter 2 n=1 Tax=Tieghemiomyces parasiticus TaxID=78921 RepID=A0A9W8AI49_9FUNG|nr:Transcriptional adapter ada2 [Tieghemiomyces parasiticus]
MAEARTDRNWRYTCDYCQSNISRTVRIRCAECSDFDTCVTCFSQGIELGQHRNYHKYQVVTPNFFPIYTEDWSADEEMLLLEGIQQFGLGNWMDVAEHVGTKNKEACERHYQQVYLDSPQWPRPRFEDVEFDASKPATRPPAFKKARVSTPNARMNKPLASQPTNHEIQGYMPARLEFEVEHENDAENTVKDLVFAPDDLPEDTELKLVVMDIYNARLTRRVERKRFISERGLLEYKKLQATEKKRTKEERDLWNKCKPLARLQTHEDYQTFVQGLIREAQLRQQIAVLQEYRQNGLTTLHEGERYEASKVQRWHSLRAHGIRDHSNLSLNMDRSQRSAAAHPGRAVAQHHFDTNITASIVADSASARPSSPPPPPATSSSASVVAGPTPSIPAAPVAAVLASGARKPPNPLNLENAEGVHLLSPDEQALCSALRIFPRPYLVIKETILKEYARRGSLRRRQTRELIKIDVNKTSRIYDFFVSMGWITAPGRQMPH